MAPYQSICDFTMVEEKYLVGWNRKSSNMEVWDMKSRELLKKVNINGTFIKKINYDDNKVYYVNGSKIESIKLNVNKLDEDEEEEKMKEKKKMQNKIINEKGEEETKNNEQEIEKNNEEELEKKEEIKTEEKKNQPNEKRIEMKSFLKKKKSSIKPVHVQYNELYEYCANILKFPSDIVIQSIEELDYKKKLNFDDSLQTQINFITGTFNNII
jgi:hypothetical protein